MSSNQGNAPVQPWKRELVDLTKLAIPVVLSELGWMAQGVVDTIMVGALGPAAIGAVAVGNAVFYTPSLFGIGLLLSLDTMVAQAYGRKDYDDCHRWLAQGIYLAAAITPILMILVGVASFGFSFVGITPEVATPGAAYLRVLDWSLLPLLIYGAARRYLQETFAEVKDRAERVGIDVEHHIITGDHPVPAILAYVHEHGFDLVVCGHHHGSRAGRHLLGSFAGDLVSAATTPVLVVGESDV